MGGQVQGAEASMNLTDDEYFAILDRIHRENGEYAEEEYETDTDFEEKRAPDVTTYYTCVRNMFDDFDRYQIEKKHDIFLEKQKNERKTTAQKTFGGAE